MDSCEPVCNNLDCVPLFVLYRFKSGQEFCNYWVFHVFCPEPPGYCPRCLMLEITWRSETYEHDSGWLSINGYNSWWFGAPESNIFIICLKHRPKWTHNQYKSTFNMCFSCFFDPNHLNSFSISRNNGSDRRKINEYVNPKSLQHIPILL